MKKGWGGGLDGGSAWAAPAAASRIVAWEARALVTWECVRHHALLAHADATWASGIAPPRPASLLPRMGRGWGEWREESA
jgi:hypothetical protein